MKILFTPWRYSYLTSPKGDQPAGCIFCIAATSDDVRADAHVASAARTRW